MKKLLPVIALLLLITNVMAQSAIQTVNSGSIIAPASSVSIGEIVIVPQSTSQSQSGIIGILAQNQQTLEVPQFDVAANVVAYPNPTTAGIRFQSNLSLAGETVYIINNVGQLVSQKKIGTDQTLDLEILPAGVYLIRFSDKKFIPFKIIKH